MIRCRIILFILFTLKCLISFSQAGSCDSTVPIYNVDLTGSTTESWEVQGIIRDGSCCSYSHPPVSCVQFIVTLNEGAEGIIFNVTDGALPQNLTWQLMNPAGDYCDPTEYPADIPVCLDGVGPHTIIFCKPGGNDNTYTITSVPAPSASEDVIVNDGCSDILQAFGFDPSSIQWNSVYPGIYGDYNNYLDCDTCQTVTVTGQAGLPAYIDYQVCGYATGSCSQIRVCDTVRATFNTTLFVNILPEQPTICFGATSISITANGIGGSQPYSFLWSNGDSTASVNVGAGTYIVTISDISGCPPNYDTVIVTAFTSTILANAGSDIDICEDNFPVNLLGFVQAAPGGIWSGGTGTYNPSNIDLNALYTPSNAELFSGIATLYLTTTGNGTCPADTDDVKISIHIFKAEINNFTNVSCNGGSDGTANVNVTVGTMPFSYLWSNGETTATATNLSSGINTVTVSDFFNCEKILTVTLTEPAELTATGSSTSANCGGSSGTATINPSGGTPPYSYLWNNSQTTQTIINIVHGMYYVTVTDSRGCQDFIDVFVDDLSPPFVDITSFTNVNCNGENTGEATVTITTPGVGVHTYSWNSNPVQTTATAVNLSAGVYIIVVTDEDGCTGLDQVTITEPSPIDIIFSNTNITCYGQSNGSSNPTVSGGTYPYTYIWSTGATTSFIINKPAGNYYLTVTDDKGCIKIDSTTLSQPSQLIFASSSQTNIKCNGNNTGAAVITVQGGIYPYSNIWSSGQTSSIISNLYAGTYSVTVTDSVGCKVDTSFTITEPQPITISLNSTQVSCFAGNNGSISSTVTGGTPSYQYLWSNGASTTSISNLIVGNYNLMVIDINGCSQIKSMQITQPGEITAELFRDNVSCFGSNDGTAEITLNGGITPYSYSWSNGQVQYSAINLSADTYYISVLDANNCPLDTFVQILEPPILTVNLDSTNITCNGYNNGEIDITVDGGIYPYTFNWSNSETSEDISNLASGGYFVTVTDYNGCTILENTVINEPLAISTTINTIDTKCYESEDGSANLTVSGGTAPYSFSWSNSFSEEDLTDVFAGTYFVTVTDINGCKNQDTAIINKPDTLSISFIVSEPTCFNYSDGNINTTVTGGTPNFSYLWDEQANSQTQAQAYNLSAATYSITITDINGCSKIDSVEMSQPNEINVNAIGGDTACPSFSTTISANATGGIGSPYTYLWNNGLGSGQQKVVSPVVTTIYSVSAFDSNNCQSDADSVTILVRNLFPENLTITSAGDVCVGLTTTVSGSYFDEFGSFILSWNNGLGNGTGPFSVKPDTTTIYTLTVTNICNNSISDSITVNVNPYPVISLNGEYANGCEPLTVIFKDSLPPTYTYLWLFGDGSSSTLVSPSHTYLENGQYSVTLTVTSDKNCSSTSSGDSYVVVNDNPKPSLIANPQISNIRNPKHDFSVTSPVITNVLWSFGDGDTTSVFSPQHTYSDTGKYVVTAQTVNEFGCINSNVITVIVNPDYFLDVPNAFTPDPNNPNGGFYNINDPNNDIFFPFSKFVKKFKMSIYNRWGELIFESLDINFGWNGFYKGVICKQDVYVWIIEVEYTNNTTEKRTGYVTLIR